MLGEVLEKKMEPVPVEQTECWQKRESSLKFMTRTIKCMPNDEGSSIFFSLEFLSLDSHHEAVLYEPKLRS